MSSIVPRHFPANAAQAGRGNDVGIGAKLAVTGIEGLACKIFS
jgi:hypothetical protein